MGKEFETTIGQIKDILLAEENKAREVIWTNYKKEIEFSYRVVATTRYILERDNKDFSPRDVLRGVTIFFLVKGVKTARAIIACCRNGWNIESSMLLRSLLESLIYMLYIVDGGEERANLYAEYDHVLRKQIFEKNIANKIPGYERFGRERDEIIKNYERVKDNYRNKRSWSGKTIKQMAKEVGLEWDYEFIYWLASNMTHSNVRSSIHYVEWENESLLFHLGPTGSYLIQNLASMCNYLLIMLKKTAEVFEVQLGESITQLEGEFQSVFTTKNENADI